MISFSYFLKEICVSIVIPRNLTSGTIKTLTLYKYNIIWGGEPMAQRELELGDVIKAAREKSDLTAEALSEKVGVTERHLYRIRIMKRSQVMSFYINLFGSYL